MIRFYILQGHTPHAVDVTVWARWFENYANRLVAQTVVQTTIGHDVLVSTVFLGIDYRDPPLLFETMIFGGRHEGYQERCATWSEAEEQHERACSLVRSTPPKQTPSTASARSGRSEAE